MKTDQTAKILRSASENNSRAVGMDRAANDNPNVPGAGDQLESFKPVAEPGHGGDANGLEPESAPTPAILNSRLNRLIEKNLPDPTEKLQKRLKAIEKAKSLLDQRSRPMKRASPKKPSAKHAGGPR